MRSRTLVIAALASAFAAAAPAGDQSPANPDVTVDLRTPEGLSAAAARWRYTDVHIVGADHKSPGPDLKATGSPVRTHDIHPRINTPDFESAAWTEVAPDALETRRTNGRLAFGWYRLDITLPARIGNVDTEAAAVVLETVIDDYAEVWVNGSLPQVLGQRTGPVVGGWNAPSRVVLAPRAIPGQTLHVAIFAANAPLSDPPPNYVWMRSATLDIYKTRSAMVNPPVKVEAAITRADTRLDSIIAPDTPVERLVDGFSFTEGPLWVPRVADNRYGGGGPGGYLLFSDPNRNVIHRYDALTGDVSIFRTKSGYTGVGGADIGEYHQPGSNGLSLDPQGRLTICEHGNRRITRLEPNGTITVLADHHEGKRLNSPNDCVYRSDGALFFTDPPFGLPKVFDDPRKELPYSGVYCLNQGSLRLVSTELGAPNGLAFSPDEKHLYIDNWEESRKVVLRFDVANDGSLTSPVVFADLTGVKGEICLDGLKVDQAGNVFLSGPGGVWVFSPDGTHLGTIMPPELPANFAFGDEDRKTLYMTARTGLYRVRLLTGGR